MTWPARVRFQMAISRASMARAERSDLEICQPTTIREKTSMTNGGIDPTFKGADVGQVGDPQPLGSRRLECAVDEVIGAPLTLVGAGGGLEGSATPGTGQAHLSHEPLEWRGPGGPGDQQRTADLARLVVLHRRSQQARPAPSEHYGLWPTSYALTKLTDSEEIKIAKLVKKAVSMPRSSGAWKSSGGWSTTPASDVEPPRHDHTEMHVWSSDQLAAFLRATEGDWLWPSIGWRCSPGCGEANRLASGGTTSTSRRRRGGSCAAASRSPVRWSRPPVPRPAVVCGPSTSTRAPSPLCAAGVGAVSRSGWPRASRGSSRTYLVTGERAAVGVAVGAAPRRRAGDPVARPQPHTRDVDAQRRAATARGRRPARPHAADAHGRLRACSTSRGPLVRRRSLRWSTAEAQPTAVGLFGGACVAESTLRSEAGAEPGSIGTQPIETCRLRPQLHPAPLISPNGDSNVATRRPLGFRAEDVLSLSSVLNRRSRSGSSGGALRARTDSGAATASAWLASHLRRGVVGPALRWRGCRMWACQRSRKRAGACRWGR
jgi:hypothetical protein